MKYINKNNGAIIDTPCLIYGKDWELLEEKEKATTEEKEKATTEVKEKKTEKSSKRK